MVMGVPCAFRGTAQHVLPLTLTCTSTDHTIEDGLV